MSTSARKDRFCLIFLFFLFGFSFAVHSRVYAHQPVIVGQQTAITVKDPEVSKAYYGELAGKPAVYTIYSAKPFDFYVNLLVPNTNGAKTDLSLEVRKEGVLVQELYGLDGSWLDLYEPFGDDYYLKGPEFGIKAEPGSYTVKVYSQSDSGKYSLAVGKTEKFGFFETIAALRAMPALKKDFFQKSPWTAYNNYMGLGSLIFLVLVILVVYFLATFLRRRKMKSDLDGKYKKAEEESNNFSI